MGTFEPKRQTNISVMSHFCRRHMCDQQLHENVTRIQPPTVILYIASSHLIKKRLSWKYANNALDIEYILRLQHKKYWWKLRPKLLPSAGVTSQIYLTRTDEQKHVQVIVDLRLILNTTNRLYDD